MSKKITTSIIGATGYTGIELLKILLNHPNVQLKYLTSTSQNCKISEIYPHLQEICDIKLSNPDLKKVARESEVTFICVPHLESQKIIPQILGLTKIIDLSGDFRVKDPKLFAKYYGHTHECPENLVKFCYGLPEINKVQGPNIANPGCFATVCQLALFPIKNLIKKVAIIAITGSSGSGKIPTDKTHHPVRDHNLQSYKIDTHQHIPEITQSLGLKESDLTLVPTSGPFTRGIHMTAFVELENSAKPSLRKNGDIVLLFKKTYAQAPFIRIKDQVELATVIGSNFCDIAIHQNGKIIIQAVIDNLIKGAAGTAVQNFNLLFKLDQSTGLKNLIPLYP